MQKFRSTSIKIQLAIEIYKHPRNFNGGNGFAHFSTWKPVISTRSKQHDSPHIPPTNSFRARHFLQIFRLFFSTPKEIHLHYRFLLSQTSFFLFLNSWRCSLRKWTKCRFFLNSCKPGKSLRYCIPLFAINHARKCVSRDTNRNLYFKN